MKYDDDFNKTSTSSGSQHHHQQQQQPMKPVVGIIKKTSSYRPPVLYSTSSLRTNIDNNGVETRTTTPTGNPDDLVIVGYSSNLYRDDFMALKLESRDMLIPWNGNQNLLVDRYDCRGYLYDLEPYDADLMSEERRNPKCSREEIEMEQACDLERYMSLKDDDDDEDEREEKKLDENGDEQDDIDDSNREIGPNSKRYGNVGFSYDASAAATVANKNGVVETEQADISSKSSEKLFVPDEALQLPVGMLVPETVKMNQIVVKTASFVAKQGLQMEILLKTKQAANSQFDFLNFDNHLNPYYKHLIQLIRDNKIDPTVYLVEPKEDDKKSNDDDNDDEEDDDDDDDDDDNYLHPLLFKKIEPPPVVKIDPKKPQEEEEKEVNEEINERKEETVENVDDEKKKEEKKETSEREEDKEEKEKEEEEDVEMLEEPEGVTKTIVDKLAEYVGRNGREFEKNIAKKGDDRFDFIKPGHKYHKYYCKMIEKAKKCLRDELEEEEEMKRRKKKEDEEKKKTAAAAAKTRSRSSSSSSSSSDEHSDREKKKRKKEKEKEKSSHKKSSSSSSSHHHHKSKKKHRKKSKDRHR